MATQTFEQLIAGANKIKENELPESNTHDLIGEQLLQMTNKMREISLVEASEAAEEAKRAAEEAKEMADIASQSGELAQYAKEQGDYAKSAGDKVTNEVLFKTAQSLTEEEQAQVKQNIGVTIPFSGLQLLDWPEGKEGVAVIDSSNGYMTSPNIPKSSYVICNINIDTDSKDKVLFVCPNSTSNGLPFYTETTENYTVRIEGKVTEVNSDTMCIECYLQNNKTNTVTLRCNNLYYPTDFSNDLFKGQFNTPEELDRILGKKGAYAFVGNPRHLYDWDNGWNDRGEFVTDIDTVLNETSEKAIANKTVTAKFSELERNTGLKIAYKLNKSDLPLKDVEESGIYFVDEKGNVFMVYSNDKGLDVSKISASMAQKILEYLDVSTLKSTAEVEEDGAFLCNEKGEVFARFVNGKFEAIGLSGGGTSNVENLEDIKNVVGGSAGQFLQKQPNGNWAGANINFPQSALSGLTDVNVNPIEGSILQYKGGKWVNAEISTEGLITTDSRASHPMYGKHFICLGDSHSAIQSFLPKLAELTGAIYHSISEKNIEGSTHIVIDGVDKGTFNKAYPYDWSAYIQAVIDAKIQIDYLIIENCHFGEKTKWDNAITSFPFVGYQKIFYPTKFNSFEDLSSHLTNELWPSIISELGINDIKKSIEFQYLASASQTLVFSFTEGETLNTDVTVTIKFGEDGSPINTTLNTGMSLDECVSKINDWAFQEYSDWTNAIKGQQE